MDKYLKIIQDSFTGYFNYLVNEILNPSWVNYFYLLIGVSILVWLLEIAFPWRKNQKIFRKDFFLDLFYLFFNFFLFSLIAYNALSNVAVELFNDFLSLFGISNVVAFHVDNLPAWLQLLIVFIVADFIHWNVHRLLHHNKFLWRFHKVHHSVKEMGFAAHLRFHWMENIIYKSIQYIPLTMIGFGLESFFIAHAIALTIGHLNHANLKLTYGPLKYIFNNPVMHLYHHAYHLPKDRGNGMNFGISLSLWDYLFNTAHIPKVNANEKLGFEGDENYPKDFWNQSIEAFKNK